MDDYSSLDFEIIVLLAIENDNINPNYEEGKYSANEESEVINELGCLS